MFPFIQNPDIKRSNYVKIDRYKLSYLNWFDKIACIYCGYANGIVNYLVAVAGATEKYWCGIKHKKYKNFVEPKHHQYFLEYGDKQAFDEFIKK